MTADARLGVDVGGTFTDVVVTVDGKLSVTKVSSTPDAPDVGVSNGVETACTEREIDPAAMSSLAHGTTVATNAVLEREWATTALLTTAGFRDALEIGRQDRPSLYDLHATKPEPIVPRDRRVEVDERLDERGSVLTELDESSVYDAIDSLSEEVDSVAVSLLFSFENDDHEQRVAEIVTAETGLPVSRSSEVLPEIREYERTVATTLDAALRPVMEQYLGALDHRLADLGVDVGMQVMGSNGGSMSVTTAREHPVRTLLSGPAAGVQGARFVAELAGFGDVVTMDMGGTSCDASLVQGGEPSISTGVTVGDYPVQLPMVDIHTVGSGGGSIARVDDGGALHVGPASAGADPGPICYGRGGTQPTVTDAHFVLGRLDPGRFDAEFEPDEDTVRKGIARHVADPLETSVEDAAAGILAVANATMERSLRVVSIERGHDPRELGLVAFGGAGPLHAVELADALDVPRVLVPRAAGTLSALGLLASDVVYDYSATRVRDWDHVEVPTVERLFEEFENQGRERLASEGIPPERHTFDRSLDVRYTGQTFDLTVPAPDPFDADTRAVIVDRFHEAHERRYGHASRDEDIELVAVRVRARGHVEPPELHVERSESTLADAHLETRPVRFDSSTQDAAVYARGKLPVQDGFEGPAVIEGSESTLVVPPGATAEMDEFGNIAVEVDP